VVNNTVKIFGKIKQSVRKNLFSAFHSSRIQMRVSVGEQLNLIQQYKSLSSPFSFNDIGFQNFSGTNEDGILLYIFAILGVTNKKLVDIGAALPFGSNSANLLIGHHWDGLLIDGSSESKSISDYIYKQIPATRTSPPIYVNEFVTSDNINDILKKNGFEGDIDLLSLDIDGIDYWVLKSISIVQPRVIIVEYQTVLGSDLQYTIPNDPEYRSTQAEINLHDSKTILYAGASLKALNNLMNEKGYYLAGCNYLDFNAFFIRKNLYSNLLPEISISDCFSSRRTKELISKYQSSITLMDWDDLSR